MHKCVTRDWQHQALSPGAVAAKQAHQPLLSVLPSLQKPSHMPIPPWAAAVTTTWFALSRWSQAGLERELPRAPRHRSPLSEEECIPQLITSYGNGRNHPITRYCWKRLFPLSAKSLELKIVYWGHFTGDSFWIWAGLDALQAEDKNTPTSLSAVQLQGPT